MTGGGSTTPPARGVPRAPDRQDTGHQGTGHPDTGRPDRRRHDREILTLAVPAFGALVAEPLFLLGDSAIVGHLGTAQLAGLGVAGTALSTLAGIFVFLAYATTAAVARRVGAGDRRAAVQQGIDGVWLALLLAVPVALLAVLLAPQVAALLGSSATAAPYAVTYLRISALGIPAMLMVLAVTGVLRGLQDTRTPLLVAVGGFTANLGLNLVLVYGAHLGVAGSAWGTVLAQSAMAACYLAVVVRGARREGAALRPDRAGIRACARAGGPLVIRTLSLRAVLVLAMAVAARLGDREVAAHQIAMALWSFLAFALDAIAIAGQAIIGRYLGAGDEAGARAATRRMVEWGLGSGVLLGLLVVLARPLYIPLFTADPAVRAQLSAVLLLVALTQPASGPVFVLDGVLMGAGDGGYLAWAMLGTLVAFAPLALAVPAFGWGLAGLWWALNAFILVRCAFLFGRLRTGRWLVTGAVRA
ncbi:MATE family efflux transporter [Kitasatospora sp. NBC_01287]|uniref:MATE family efflux transporter n=1 Tax=Kitasatospora sp. NBC_01287 TaxID=2903573 RepID=UPI0022578288|nr:MATE family efflux transporter [Kitasatospora sp. NBC_01287]MCX4747641.1 MATE family efflux transporter [Kitasatospora sp. NBC_01287]